MIKPPIIIIINKKPYTVSAMDVDSVRNIPDADRQQLVALLETLKSVDNSEKAPSSISQLSTSARVKSTTTVADNFSVPQTGNPQRLASGDVDALMAQLIMEDKLNKKPPLTKHTIQKWTAAMAIVIFLLVILL